jgi:LacI family transcriptional regulator
MATLEQIARRAGVSKMTVSNVLNGRNKELWPSAVERAEGIRRIAQELGYRPNAAARAIGRGRFNNVAMVLGQSAQHMPDGLLRGAAQALAERDLSLSITEIPDNKLTSEGFVPRILRELSSDGLLINYIHHVPPTLAPLLQSNRVPSIWINVKADCNCVRPDDLGGSLEATRHLLSLGHRRIAYIRESSVAHYSSVDRLAGYEAAMTEAGLAPRVVTTDAARYSRHIDRGVETTREDDRLAAMTSLLRSADRPTAILAVGIAHATPILLAAARCGLDVPRDLSVMTFSDWPPDHAGQLITFMHVSMTDVGHQAVRLLADRISDPATDLPPVAVPFKLMQGQTLAPRNS